MLGIKIKTLLEGLLHSAIDRCLMHNLMMESQNDTDFMAVESQELADSRYSLFMLDNQNNLESYGIYIQGMAQDGA